MTTAELRKALYNYLSTQGCYVCHEVAVPKDRNFAIDKARAANVKPIFEGRVDMVMYQKSYREKSGTFRFYEMKISVEDFKSLHGHNFEGNFNYYVVPSIELYEKVKHLIPPFVGCLVYRATNPSAEELASIGHSKSYIKLNAERSFFDCVKKPRRQELQCSYDKLIHSFITALSRECCRHNVGYYKAR